MTKKDVIKILYPYIRGPLVAEYLDITVSKMYNFVWDIGLKKHPKFKHQMNSALAIEAGERTRFKKGQVPHNKGKKMPQSIYDKAAPTMFKKGNKPFNTREENAMSIRKDTKGRDYCYSKVADSKWVLTHRLVWEQANGPIPARHIIRFIDGNTMNYDLSNLECISMRENINKNTIQRFPKDLQQVIKLKSKLNKTINNGKKRNE